MCVCRIDLGDPQPDRGSYNRLAVGDPDKPTETLNLANLTGVRFNSGTQWPKHLLNQVEANAIANPDATYIFRPAIEAGARAALIDRQPHRRDGRQVRSTTGKQGVDAVVRAVGGEQRAGRGVSADLAPPVRLVPGRDAVHDDRGASRVHGCDELRRDLG
jgi:hypothetical protein